MPDATESSEQNDQPEHDERPVQVMNSSQAVGRSFAPAIGMLSRKPR
jgi:hypothetical protein